MGINGGTDTLFRNIQNGWTVALFYVTIDTGKLIICWLIGNLVPVYYEYFIETNLIYTP